MPALPDLRVARLPVPPVPALPAHLPRPPQVHSPRCRSSRSPSSPGTKRRTSATALASVAWADEIIVVDSESTDETVAIARRHTDRVVVREWPGYVEQKNYAASIASHDWILSLDADERVTPELADEIKALLAGAPAARGVPHPARDLAPRALDPDHRLVSRLSAAALRPARRAMDRAVRARGGDGPRRRSASCAASCSTSPIVTSPITSKPSIATRRYAARQMHESGPARRTAADLPAIRRWRSCATTSRAAASATACPASSSRR